MIDRLAIIGVGMIGASLALVGYNSILFSFEINSFRMTCWRVLGGRVNAGAAPTIFCQLCQESAVTVKPHFWTQARPTGSFAAPPGDGARRAAPAADRIMGGAGARQAVMQRCPVDRLCTASLKWCMIRRVGFC